MVERSDRRKPTFNSFEVRRAFFREAIRAGTHKKHPEIFLPLALVGKNFRTGIIWTDAKNIMGVYYFTDAPIEKIATLYGIPESDARAIIRLGTEILWYYSPSKIKDKYSLYRFTGSPASMRKTKPAKASEEIDKKTRVVKPQTPIERKPKAAVLPEQSTESVGEIAADQHISEELIEEIDSDLDMWNMAVRQGWIDIMLKRKMLDEKDKEDCAKYFSGEIKTPPELALEKFTLAFVKLDREK